MAGARGAVRIIGGRWRGTRITVGATPGLRPSADRVRETLFNWLAPCLDGARCLDLYAGSGVLGFEALSRGAAAAVLVERDAAAAVALTQLAARLGTGAAEVVRADVLDFLATPARPFDIVFVDPPFAADVRPQVLARLTRGWLAPHALVYLESAREAADPAAPWQVYKSGTTRQASYKLIRYAG
ncbi:MAG: 16S rRNA (guanine(966)-N(2))-methyltransferase RsmD [Gammaproteobacteria bacterium]